MNKRYTQAETVLEDEMLRREAQVVEVEIDAELIDNYDGKVKLRLGGVKLAHIDWPAMQQMMASSGIDEGDCDFLMNTFANQTEQHLLAKALAKRLRRVG